MLNGRVPAGRARLSVLLLAPVALAPFGLAVGRCRQRQDWTDTNLRIAHEGSVDLVAAAQERTDGPRIEFIHNFRFSAEAWIPVITADGNQPTPIAHTAAIVTSTEGAGNAW